ncbi:MAG TPA: FkbM family methyltransferase [Terriglobales bacterium]|nr:FkbM family methyltransferase [Terriglobales bacterium]
MKSTVLGKLKLLRDNYYFSRMLAGVAKPLWLVCGGLATQLQMKVRKNGVTISLPNGQAMTIGRNAGIGLASTLFWHGIDGYEPLTSAALRFFFARSTTFIDVGANCGLYSIMAALWSPCVRVIAFEAFPPIYEKLKTNVVLNDLEGRIVCENLALSSESGVGIFRIPQSDTADFETTGTLSDQGFQVRQGCPTVPVRTVRFDDYESSHPMRVDLVKIDVEDFEAHVLEGMSATIQRDKPFIICEILNREHRNERTLEIIQSLNYTAYWITDAGYIRVSRFDFERRRFTDFVLSPVSNDAEVLNDLGLLCEARNRLLARPA